MSFLYSRLILFHSLRFVKPSQIIPIKFQTMSQTQRYMSRTAGRVERRGAPAPYTPTKPAPTTPVCHAFVIRLAPDMLTIPIRRRSLLLFGIILNPGLFLPQARTQQARCQNPHLNRPRPQIRPHHSEILLLVIIGLRRRTYVKLKRPSSPCKPRRQRTCMNAASR